MFDLKRSEFILVLCVLGFTHYSSAQVCLTPNDERGTCINLLNCDYFLNLIKTQNQNPRVVEYLRGATCGYEGKYPMVCCPLQPDGSKTLPPDPTPSPQSQTTQQPIQQRYTLPRSPNCGINNASNWKIVGGDPAKLGEFPWIAELGYRNSKNRNLPKWLCGGALITNKHVLTAGHCVYNKPDLYVVRLGELDLYSDDDGAQPIDVPVEKVKIHENYSPQSFTNDIAIVTLTRPASGLYISPICLPLEDNLRRESFVRHYPLVAGWGALYFNGPSSSRLQVVMLPVVSNDQCRQAFVNFKQTVIDERILCAGYVRGGKDACQGDSGGPLMLAKGQNPSVFYQIGVVSYGFRCAEEGFPGVYSRVTHFLDWIQNNLD